MAKKNFSVDDTLYKAQAKKLVRELKLDEPKFVREQAGIFAQLLCKITPPFKSFPKMRGRPTYTTGGAQSQGKKAVRAGFFSAVQRMGNLSKWKSKSIRSAIRAGDTSKLTVIFANMKNSNKHGMKVRNYSDQLRNSKRNARGRVNRGTQPIVAITNADVNKGLKRAVNNVGIAKSSFALAALRLGRKSPPKWISKHFSKVNTPVKMPTAGSPIARFTSSAKGLDVTMRRLKDAERFRLKAMVLNLKSIVKANAKKAGFKTR